MTRAWIRLYCASGLFSLWLALLLLGWFDPPWVHLLLAAAIAIVPYRAFAPVPLAENLAAAPAATPEDVRGAAPPGEPER